MRENKMMQEFSCTAARGYKETNKLLYSSPNSRKKNLQDMRGFRFCDTCMNLKLGQKARNLLMMKAYTTYSILVPAITQV
jgi:hypothetical protein